MTHRMLSHLRVIESSAFIAAPLAGLTLAQFGADVIRVDLIGGGIDYARLPRMPHPQDRGRSLYWTGLNQGKRSIAIDLRRPEGRELVQALVTAPSTASGRPDACRHCACAAAGRPHRRSAGRSAGAGQRRDRPLARCRRGGRA